MSQFGVLLIVVLSMGGIAQEKERGTAAMLFARPVRRSALIVSKWLAWVIVIVVSLLPGALACFVYTRLLFDWLPVAQFLALNGLVGLFFVVYLSVALLASALARNQGIAAGLAFGGLALLLVFSSLPRIGEYFPGQLLVWGQALTDGFSDASWPALWIALFISVAALVLAGARLEREEI
jgi:ABC-2 type transport system permease protein